MTMWQRLGGSLFLRTFILLALLLAISLGVWFQSLRIFEREPRAQQFATQVVSVVKLTRTALQYSDFRLRLELLQDLVHNEDIKVYPREPEDVIRAWEEYPFDGLASEKIRQQLGRDTILATHVNDIPAFWISFDIDQDQYWVALSRERVDRFLPIQLVWWGIAALSLALLGAAFVTSLINSPLSRLARAAQAIGAGKSIDPLSEHGGGDIATTNRSFNQMVRDLAQLESDRALMLAGISHDLRTPLTRIRLEAELSVPNYDARQALINDIEQIDTILEQFMDYARPVDNQLQLLDLTNLIRESVRSLSSWEDLEIKTHFPQQPRLIKANIVDLQRLIDNLFENARRYGRDISGMAHVTVRISEKERDERIWLTISDRGPGVEPAQLAKLTRPFYRVDAARSAVGSAGLGLWIVQRICMQLDAKLELRNQTPPSHGLIVRIGLKPA